MEKRNKLDCDHGMQIGTKVGEFNGIKISIYNCVDCDYVSEKMITISHMQRRYNEEDHDKYKIEIQEDIERTKIHKAEMDEWFGNGKKVIRL